MLLVVASAHVRQKAYFLPCSLCVSAESTLVLLEPSIHILIYFFRLFCCRAYMAPVIPFFRPTFVFVFSRFFNGLVQHLHRHMSNIVGKPTAGGRWKTWKEIHRRNAWVGRSERGCFFHCVMLVAFPLSQ